MLIPVLAGGSVAASAQVPTFDRIQVTFPSNGLSLTGCVAKPAGPGPFPVIIWNHGSEQNPPCTRRMVAEMYTAHGYAVFFPIRHGHANSPGEYIGTAQKRAVADHPRREDWNADVIRLHEFYNRDVVAAVQWVKQQRWADTQRLAMSGLSYGGIQTLLAAEQGLGLRAFVPFAAGAMSWGGNPALHTRLLQAVRAAPVPIFLLQASNDYSLGPSDVLGPEIRKKGAPNDAKVYPAHGTTAQQGHGGFALDSLGVQTWQADVLAFLERCGMAPAVGTGRRGN